MGCDVQQLPCALSVHALLLLAAPFDFRAECACVLQHAVFAPLVCLSSQLTCALHCMQACTARALCWSSCRTAIHRVLVKGYEQLNELLLKTVMSLASCSSPTWQWLTLLHAAAIRRCL